MIDGEKGSSYNTTFSVAGFRILRSCLPLYLVIWKTPVSCRYRFCLWRWYAAANVSSYIALGTFCLLGVKIHLLGCQSYDYLISPSCNLTYFFRIPVKRPWIFQCPLMNICPLLLFRHMHRKFVYEKVSFSRYNDPNSLFFFATFFTVFWAYIFAFFTD